LTGGAPYSFQEIYARYSWLQHDRVAAHIANTALLQQFAGDGIDERGF
jgi:hypothetical protein